MNIHMHTKAALRWKTFLTLSTWIQIFSSMSLSVNFQLFFMCKPFVTHCTQIRLWLVVSFLLHHSWFTIAAPCVYTGNKCVINCIVMSWIAMYDTEELKMKSTGRVFHTSEVSCEVKVWLHFIITSTKCYWSQCRSVIICWEIVYHRLRGSASPVLTTTHHSYVNMSLHSKLSTLNYRRTWHWIIAVY